MMIILSNNLEYHHDDISTIFSVIHVFYLNYIILKWLLLAFLMNDGLIRQS